MLRIFFSGELAEIDPELCINCGMCVDVCRFDAVKVEQGVHKIDALNCEGCGYCARVCPVKAINNIQQNVGKCYISEIKTGAVMVHARLGIGADNSGKLVAKVKNEAKKIAVEKAKGFVLVDGSPGVGCPVVSSLSGANFAVLVTEPTVSGIHDLKRVYELVKKFKIPAGCIINKADLDLQKQNEILAFLESEKIAEIACLPYDETFTKAMTLGKSIVEYDNGELKKQIENAWERIKILA
jgi:MinD superfamily P-loop ATPase